MHKNGTFESGFSLIELMIAVAILAIVVGLGLPNLKDFLVSNRLTSDINSFVGLVNFARSEAITRNQSVVICPKSAVDISCSNSLSWNEFEIQAFVDVDGNNARDSGDILLKTLPIIDATGLQTEFERSLGTANNITFGTSGFSQSILRFDIHAVNSGDAAYELKYGRSICVSRPGRVRVVAYNTTNCTDF